MNPPTTGTQIAEDRVDRYRSFGAFGKPAWQSHIQLRAMIRQRLGERCANYFAVPTYDPDAGVIRWTVPVGGKVRAHVCVLPVAALVVLCNGIQHDGIQRVAASGLVALQRLQGHGAVEARNLVVALQRVELCFETVVKFNQRS